MDIDIGELCNNAPTTGGKQGGKQTQRSEAGKAKLSGGGLGRKRSTYLRYFLALLSLLLHLNQG